MIRWLILTFAAGYVQQRARLYTRNGYTGQAITFDHIATQLLKMR